MAIMIAGGVLTVSLHSNGRQTVGDGAFSSDMTPSVIAVCQMQGSDSMYYYSTTFSGGPGVRPHSPYILTPFHDSPYPDPNL